MSIAARSSSTKARWKPQTHGHSTAQTDPQFALTQPPRFTCGNLPPPTEPPSHDARLRLRRPQSVSNRSAREC